LRSHLLATRLLEFSFASFLVFTGQTRTTPEPSSRTPLLIREEQQITINGIPETWRLEWKLPPEYICGPDLGDHVVDCPCSPFAYGETAPLDLVRIVKGREIDRLKLTQFFEQEFQGQQGAVVQRWEPDDKDLYDTDDNTFVARVHGRPVVKVMQFADYNHDGQPTEFFLSTGVLPCGKNMGIVVGLTPANPRLHAFGTALHPNEPLVMQKREWQALLNANSAVSVLDWRCGDHGSDTETQLELTSTREGIQGTRREFTCTENGSRGQLLSEHAF
jgi:hypothetical protein